MTFEEKIEKIKSVTMTVVRLLVNEDFAKIDQLTKAEVCSAEDLMCWIDLAEHPVKLTFPPQEAFDDISYGFLENGKRNWTYFPEPYPTGCSEHNVSIQEVIDGSYQVNFWMWIEPCERSDYMLVLSLREDESGNFQPAMEGLYVP